MASFNINRALLISLLVAVFAFMAAPSSVEARIPGLRNVIILPRRLNITGTVYCTRKVKLTANGTVPSYLPPFRKATVILRCDNTDLANAITNSSGKFSIVSEARYIIGPVYFYVGAGVGKCQLIVKEPLAYCDFTLPIRQLVANISAPPGPLYPIPGGILKPVISNFFLPPDA